MDERHKRPGDSGVTLEISRGQLEDRWCHIDEPRGLEHLPFSRQPREDEKRSKRGRDLERPVRVSRTTRCLISVYCNFIRGHYFKTHGASAVYLCTSPSSILRALIAAKCPTKPLSTLNAPEGKRQSERLSLSQPENCPKRSNTSRLRAARSISAVSPGYSHVVVAGQIVQAIKEGRWTSTQVVTAFIKSASRAQDEMNCVTEGTRPFSIYSGIRPNSFLVLFSDALKTAGELDAHFAATKELKGPLHGVPISFKDLSEFARKPESLGIVLTLHCS